MGSQRKKNRSPGNRPWQEEFHVPQALRRFKRDTGIVQPKDAGLVIAYSGLNKKSDVAELGSGSGFMTAYLAQIARKVVSYEMREEFFGIAQKNIEKLGLENVEFKLRNVLEGWIDERELDIIFCDLPQPEALVARIHDALKPGGVASAFCINIEQAREMHLGLESSEFREVFTVESIIREYTIRDPGTRPNIRGFMHTAYLVFGIR